MLCPKCGKEMKIMVRPEGELLPNGCEHVEVLGRCEDCDFDAKWEIVTDMNRHIEEFNFERYFFG